MSSTERFQCHGRRFVALIAGMTIAAGVWALEPAAKAASAASIQATVKDWESAEERLTALLDQVPEQARTGIERAIEANRQGRERAQAALDRSGPDSETGTARAQRALEEAAVHAEAGLAEARQHVPQEVLPKLDDASTRMRAGLAAGSAGVARESRAGARPPAMPGATPTESRRPPDMGRPAAIPRPATPGRPANRPGG